MKPYTLNDAVRTHLETINNVADNRTITGYFVLATTIRDDGSNTGSYSVYDANDLVHLVGYLHIILSDIERELLKVPARQEAKEIADRTGIDLKNTVKKESDKLN